MEKVNKKPTFYSVKDKSEVILYFEELLKRFGSKLISKQHTKLKGIDTFMPIWRIKYPIQTIIVTNTKNASSQRKHGLKLITLLWGTNFISLMLDMNLWNRLKVAMHGNFLFKLSSSKVPRWFLKIWDHSVNGEWIYLQKNIFTAYKWWMIGLIRCKLFQQKKILNNI